MTFRWGPPSTAQQQPLPPSDASSSHQACDDSRPAQSRLLFLLFGERPELSAADAHLLPQLRIYAPSGAHVSTRSLKRSHNDDNDDDDDAESDKDNNDDDDDNDKQGDGGNGHGDSNDDKRVVRPLKKLASSSTANAAHLLRVPVEILTPATTRAIGFESAIIDRVVALEAGTVVGLQSPELTAFAMSGGTFRLTEAPPLFRGRGFSFASWLHPLVAFSCATASMFSAPCAERVIKPLLAAVGDASSKNSFSNWMSRWKKHAREQPRDDVHRFENALVTNPGCFRFGDINAAAATTTTAATGSAATPPPPPLAALATSPVPVVEIVSSSSSPEVIAGARKNERPVIVVTDAASGWVCPGCTFVNALGVPVCQACNNRNMASLALKMADLVAMGFTDVERNRTLLLRFGGRIEDVVNALVS